MPPRHRRTSQPETGQGVSSYDATQQAAQAAQADPFTQALNTYRSPHATTDDRIAAATYLLTAIAAGKDILTARQNGAHKQ